MSTILDPGWLVILVPFLGVSLGAAVIAWNMAAESTDSDANPPRDAAVAFVLMQAACWLLFFWIF